MDGDEGARISMNATAKAFDLDTLRLAATLADEFEKRFKSELAQAKRAGLKLVYKLEQEEQIGRGTLNIARIRLLPISDVQKRKFKRHQAVAIEGRADYLDPVDAFDALKTACDVAFEHARDAAII